MRGSDKGCRKPEVTITSTFVADSAPRDTRRFRKANPFVPSRLSPFTNSANDAPASTSAPNVMSPLIPEKQSKCRCTPTSSLSLQDAEKVVHLTRPAPTRRDASYSKLRSRIAQRLNVRPGEELLWQLGAGGRERLRFASKALGAHHSRPSANVTLIILRVADLTAA